MLACSTGSLWPFYVLIHFPAILVGALLAYIPVGIYREFAPRRRANRSATRKPGHCRRCGYDRRASPSTCPECGDIRVREADVYRIPPRPVR